MRVCKIYPIFLALNKQDFWTLDNVHLFAEYFVLRYIFFIFISSAVLSL